MTLDEIMAMQPGSRLDALVAEKVMGWKTWEEKRSDGYLYVVFQKPGAREPYKKYQNPEVNKQRYCLIDSSEINFMKHIVYGLKEFSTDISAAWEVIEEMLRKSWSHTISFIKDYRYPNGIRHCCFSRPQDQICAEEVLGIDQGQKIFRHGYDGESTPAAICKAALVATEIVSDEFNL